MKDSFSFNSGATNMVKLKGKIVSDIIYDHNYSGVHFYKLMVSTERLTDGKSDTIPVKLTENLIDISSSHIERTVCVLGQYHSFNRYEKGKSRLQLSVYASYIDFMEDLGDKSYRNQVFLNGFICKPPVYRITPKGCEITDILLAVNRRSGKSDYIPCLCWGKDARHAASYKVGDKFATFGRIESREYYKNDFVFTAYEVSSVLTWDKDKMYTPVIEQLI